MGSLILIPLALILLVSGLLGAFLPELWCKLSRSMVGGKLGPETVRVIGFAKIGAGLILLMVSAVIRLTA